MRAYIGDSPYDTSIPSCCGINVVGDFRSDGISAWEDSNCWPKIEDIISVGCGIFISTFLPSQWRAFRKVMRHHTLLFRTGPHKNMGPDASEEGRKKGVYLCVFKYGKEDK